MAQRDARGAARSIRIHADTSSDSIEVQAAVSPEDKYSEQPTARLAWRAKVVKFSRQFLRLQWVCSNDERADEHILVWSEVIRLWRQDAAFQDAFSRCVADTPFQDFIWETPPLLAAQPFEMTLQDARGGLPRVGYDTGFAEHQGHDSSSGSVRVFRTPDSDALLISPVFLQGSRRSSYGHLGAFVRSAPAAQQRELWRVLGEVLATNLESKAQGDSDESRVRISTNGSDQQDVVPWFHIKLDCSPKQQSRAAFQNDHATGSNTGGRDQTPEHPSHNDTIAVLSAAVLPGPNHRGSTVHGERVLNLSGVARASELLELAGQHVEEAAETAHKLAKGFRGSSPGGSISGDTEFDTTLQKSASLLVQRAEFFLKEQAKELESAVEELRKCKLAKD